MKAKNIIILLVVCVALAMWSLSSKDNHQGQMAVKDPSPYAKMDMDVTRIELQKGEKKLVIRTVNGELRAEEDGASYPVDAKKARELVDAFRNLKLTNKKPGQYADKFELDDKSEPLQVSLISGDKTVAGVALGKVTKGKAMDMGMNMGMGMGGYAPDAGQYMLLNGDKDVYLSKEKIDASFDSSTWVRKNLAKVDKETVESVEVISPYKHFQLKKKVETIKKSTEENAPVETLISWSVEGDHPEGLAPKQDQNIFMGRLEEVLIAKPASAEQLAKVENTTPAYQLKVHTNSGLAYALDCIDVDGEWLIWDAAKPADKFVAQKWNLENLFSGAEDIYELGKRVIPQNDIRELNWKSGLKLHKKDADWALAASGVQPPVKKDEIKKVLDALKEMSCLDFYVDVPLAMEKRQLMLMVGEGDQTRGIPLLDLGKHPLVDSHMIHFGDTNTTWAIKTSDVNKLFPAFSSLLDLGPAPAFADLERAEFADFSIIKKDDQWDFAVGEGEVDASELESWFSGIEAVRASVYVPEADSFKAEMQFSLNFKNNLRLGVEIGPMVSGKRQLRLSPWTGVFQAPAGVGDMLKRTRKSFEKEVKEVSSPLAPAKESTEDLAPVE